MTWWKNGLLLAAGGVAGLALAAWLESESEGDDERPRRKAAKADGMELLVEKVRREAEWAMEECATDEEREKVYAEVSSSIHKLQATLQERGEAIIADLRERAAAGRKEDKDDDAENSVNRLRNTMEELTESLDKTLESLKPSFVPAVV